MDVCDLDIERSEEYEELIGRLRELKHEVPGDEGDVNVDFEP